MIAKPCLASAGRREGRYHRHKECGMESDPPHALCVIAVGLCDDVYFIRHNQNIIRAWTR